MTTYDRMSGDDGATATEFVEGIVYGPQEFVLITSRYGSSADPKVSSLPLFETWGSKAYGNRWYFQHAKFAAQQQKQKQKQAAATSSSSSSSSSSPPSSAAAASSSCSDCYVDRLPVLDYVFRHQRGFMWVVDMYVNNDCLTKSRCGRRRVDEAVAEKVAKGEEGKGLLTQLEMERCRVFQDVGVRLSRLEEGIRYVQKDLAIYPFWNCPYRAVRLDGGFTGPLDFGERFGVDLGLYGEPTVRRFENRRQLQALQRFVDYPSSWGLLYITQEELKGLKQWPLYEQVLDKYGSRDAFTPFLEKVTFPDPAGRDKGPICCWRLHDEGKFWQTMVFLALVVPGLAYLLVWWYV